jgi:flagella basal body P-ring formation protein FlgA
MKATLHITVLFCLLSTGIAWAEIQTNLHSAIDEYLESEWGEGTVEWVELSMPKSSLLNAGDRWTLDGPEKPRGRVVLYANVHKDHTTLRRIPFRIRVMPFAWVPVLVEPMQRGMLVTSPIIRWDRREVTEIRHPWPESPEILLSGNLRTRRSLSANEILTWPDVEREPEVCQGALVNLRLQKGSVVLETEGIALQDGRTGEFIRVEQEELGSLLRVKVIGHNSAEVISALGR